MERHYYSFKVSITHLNKTKVLDFKLLVLNDAALYKEKFLRAKDSDDPTVSVELMSFIIERLHPKYFLIQEQSKLKVIDVYVSEHQATSFTLDPTMYSTTCIMIWGGTSIDDTLIQLSTAVHFYNKQKVRVDALFNSFHPTDVAKIVTILKESI